MEFDDLILKNIKDNKVVINTFLYFICRI